MHTKNTERSWKIHLIEQVVLTHAGKSSSTKMKAKMIIKHRHLSTASHDIFSAITANWYRYMKCRNDLLHRDRILTGFQLLAFCTYTALTNWSFIPDLWLSILSNCKQNLKCLVTMVYSWSRSSTGTVKNSVRLHLCFISCNDTHTTSLLFSDLLWYEILVPH
jgi:hypothetical protein